MGGYRTAAFLGFGIAHLIFGILAVVLNGIGLSKLVEAHSLGGVGIWGGAFFMATGVVGIIAGCSGDRAPNAVLFLVLSALSLALSILLTVTAGLGVHADQCGCKSPEYYRKWYLRGYDNEAKRPQRVAVNSSLIAIGILELIFVALPSTIFAAIVVCTPSENQPKRETPFQAVPGLPVSPRAISFSPEPQHQKHQDKRHSGSSKQYVPGLPYDMDHLTKQLSLNNLAGQPSLSPDALLPEEMRRSLSDSRNSSLSESNYAPPPAPPATWSSAPDVTRQAYEREPRRRTNRKDQEVTGDRDGNAAKRNEKQGRDNEETSLEDYDSALNQAAASRHPEQATGSRHPDQLAENTSEDENYRETEHVNHRVMSEVFTKKLEETRSLNTTPSFAGVQKSTPVPFDMDEWEQRNAAHQQLKQRHRRNKRKTKPALESSNDEVFSSNNTMPATHSNFQPITDDNARNFQPIKDKNTSNSLEQLETYDSEPVSSKITAHNFGKNRGMGRRTPQAFYAQQPHGFYQPPTVNPYSFSANPNYPGQVQYRYPTPPYPSPVKGASTSQQWTVHRYYYNFPSSSRPAES